MSIVYRVHRTEEFLVAAADEQHAIERAEAEQFWEPGDWEVEAVGEDDGGEDVLR